MLERSEADAVLAHEMGHLLGGDTGHSKRLAPHARPLRAVPPGAPRRRAHAAHLPLHAGLPRAVRAVAGPQPARERARRGPARRERHVGPGHRPLAGEGRRVRELPRARGGGALRPRTSSSRRVAIAQRVALGLRGVRQLRGRARRPARLGDAAPVRLPPPARRAPGERGRCRSRPPTWCRCCSSPPPPPGWSAILDAEAIEARLWGAYEERFAKAHDLALAYRYVPSNEQERAARGEALPAPHLRGQGGRAAEVPLDFAQVTLRGVGRARPSRAGEVRQHGGAAVQEVPGPASSRAAACFKGKRSICLSKLQDGGRAAAGLRALLGRYQQMAARRASSASGLAPACSSATPEEVQRQVGVRAARTLLADAQSLSWAALTLSLEECCP